ncbi:MAG: SPOR domain-containing protein [Paraglaciecola sp.]|nr:SPOR domain-containing protein [Paraglaciecola sp.]
MVYLQVAALQDKSKIEMIGNALTNLYQIPYRVPFDGSIYRLQLGPLTDERAIEHLLNELKSNGYPGAYKVYQP